ncbi:hypothetical protein BJX62DRAFT_115301 [Aspergillus germanicus]
MPSNTGNEMSKRLTHASGCLWGGSREIRAKLKTKYQSNLQIVERNWLGVFQMVFSMLFLMVVLGELGCPEANATSGGDKRQEHKRMKLLNGGLELWADEIRITGGFAEAERDFLGALGAEDRERLKKTLAPEVRLGFHLDKHPSVSMDGSREAGSFDDLPNDSLNLTLSEGSISEIWSAGEGIRARAWAWPHDTHRTSILHRAHNFAGSRV